MLLVSSWAQEGVSTFQQKQFEHLLKFLSFLDSKVAAERTAQSKDIHTGHWWLMPIILATWKSEIRRISVLGQSRQIVCKTPISKISRAKWTVKP
jgi:hypothetical protein